MLIGYNCGVGKSQGGARPSRLPQRTHRSRGALDGFLPVHTMQARASCAGATIATCLRSIPVSNSARYTAISSIARRPTCRASTLRIAVPFARGAKTKTTAKLKDLPQGALKLETYSDGADEAPRYPKVVQDHRNNMEKFKNCVVLTRVGSFYEVSYACCHTGEAMELMC